MHVPGQQQHQIPQHPHVPQEQEIKPHTYYGYYGGSEDTKGHDMRPLKPFHQDGMTENEGAGKQPVTLQGRKRSVPVVTMSGVNTCQKKSTGVRFAAVLFVVAFAASQVSNSVLANEDVRADKVVWANATAPPANSRRAHEPVSHLANASSHNLHYANHSQASPNN
ncbi:hypothetical protein MRX96_010783 [Rhipicephalus microplus]